MHRVDTATAAPAQPAKKPDGTGGFFTEGDPVGGTPATVPGQDWFNTVQEEMCAVALLGGLTLDKGDDTQLATVLHGIRALLSHATDTGSVTSLDKRAVLASTLGKAAGENSLVAASDNGCEANGDNSATVASDNCQAEGERTATLASSDCVVSGDFDAAAVGSSGCTVSENSAVALGAVNSQAAGLASLVAAAISSRALALRSLVLACNDGEANEEESAAIAGDGVVASGIDSLIVASQNAEVHDNLSLAGGYSASGITPGGSNQNLTWRIYSATGDMWSDGTLGVGAADFAELFPTAAELPVGAIVTRRGRRAHLAGPGDRILGVVSAAPAVLGNAAPLSWHGRFETDAFGRRVVDQVELVRWDARGKEPGYRGPLADAPQPIPERARRSTLEVPRVAPDFDPKRPYVPRAARPGEYAPVGLVGQLRVRVDATVQADDFVAAGQGGVGTHSEAETRLECMELVQPFDEAQGYGVALCLLR